MQIPLVASQVNADLTSTDSIEEFSILAAIKSEMCSPAETNNSPVTGSITSCNEVLPTILSFNYSTTSSFFFRAVTEIPLKVPQSNSVTTTSWATSTNRLVKYPASAVLSAVSARPLRAPWVEIKYSRIDSPSLKLERIGFSIISPPPAFDFLV